MPKNKPNHLTVFINEVLKPEKLARGQKFVFSELFAEAADRFKLLPEEEKAYYKSKAKAMRPVNVTDQFFQPVAVKPSVEKESCFAATDLNAEMLKNELAAKEVHDRIQKFPSLKDLRKKEFIFASVQCFLEKEHVRPVEIAMVKWSMERGIIQQFHSLVDPGEIPIGLRSSLKEFAERTHQITEDLYSSGADNYEKLWHNILDFITYNGVREPLYSFEIRSCRLTSLCFDWLADRAGERTMGLRVDPVENLFKELFLYAGRDAELIELKEFLGRHNFDLSESLRCEYHANLQCEFCALAFCKKPVYNMLNSLSNDFCFELTTNHRQVDTLVLSSGRTTGGLTTSAHTSLESENAKVPTNPWNQGSRDDVGLQFGVRRKDHHHHHQYDHHHQYNHHHHQAPDVPARSRDKESWPDLGRDSQFASLIGMRGALVPPNVGRGRGLRTPAEQPQPTSGRGRGSLFDPTR